MARSSYAGWFHSARPLALRLAKTQSDGLLVAAEKMSAVIEAELQDPNTAIPFGDGIGPRSCHFGRAGDGAPRFTG